MPRDVKRQTLGRLPHATARQVTSGSASLPKWALAAVLTAITTAPQAEPISEEKATKAVQTWVRSVTADRRPDAVVERVEAYKKNHTTAAYIVHLGGGGYCISGADSLVLPVYWYCPGGQYDARNPETRAILEETVLRTEYLRGDVAKGGASLRLHQDTLSKREAFWSELTAGRTPSDTRPKSESDQVVLPLTSEWHQDSPYNDACPEEPAGSGNHAVVGCVATAMAQLMYYWHWPTDYQWDVLRDVHTDPVDDGDVEVARLCHDAGLAVGMEYGLQRSLANADDVPGALEDTFKYDGDADLSDRDVDRMVEEIQWLRPVLLDGRNAEDEGHMWVVLGYNLSTTPAQFRMNLGWGGDAGWYSVDDVPGDLTRNQDHVIHVAPRRVVRFVGARDSGDGSPDDPYENIEEAVSEAPDGATLIFKAGSVHVFTQPSLTIQRPLTLRGANVTIRRSY